MTSFLEASKELIKGHPYIFGITTMLGLAILVLRKIHYKFVVYPDIQGRSNKSNSFRYQHPNNRGLDSEDIEVVTSDKVTLRGWYVKKENPQSLILYYHENAGNIGGRLEFITYLSNRINANVLIVAYRGFSESDGQKSPNQAQIMRDSKAILSKGVELSKRDKIPLIVFGRSLGGASSIHTLSDPEFKYAAKGLILQNTFTSIYDVASHLMPRALFFLTPILWMITAGSYNSISKLPHVHVPILFIKGCRDMLIPKAQMDRLQSVHEGLKKESYCYEVENGTHNDTWVVGIHEYFERMNEFIKRCSKL